MLFQVMSLSQNVAGLESQIDRITREKLSLTNQLEEAQNHRASREMEINKVRIVFENTEEAVFTSSHLNYTN